MNYTFCRTFLFAIAMKMSCNKMHLFMIQAPLGNAGCNFISLKYISISRRNELAFQYTFDRFQLFRKIGEYHVEYFQNTKTYFKAHKPKILIWINIYGNDVRNIQIRLPQSNHTNSHVRHILKTIYIRTNHQVMNLILSQSKLQFMQNIYLPCSKLYISIYLYKIIVFSNA